MLRILFSNMALVVCSFLTSISANNAMAGDPPHFINPTGCQLGKTCWIANYPDVETDLGRAADFRCGKQTYDSHDGVDIALRDSAAMKEGVDALAAADGTVLRVRDGVEDRQPNPEEIKRILASNTGCGNGVVIDHGEGWQTIYCHLRRGSIAVSPRQQIKAGDAIGKVGQSGAAEFPHLHFGVLHNGSKLDPFTGAVIGTKHCGGNSVTPLWHAGSGISYAPFALYAAGFSPSPADYDQIRNDARSPDRLSRGQISAFSFWMVYFGAGVGDRISLQVTGPDGEVHLQRTVVQDKSRARQFYFIGKKASGADLKPGIYTGKVTVSRDGVDGMTSEMSKTVTLD